LILINFDDGIKTLRQLSSILIRDVVVIDHKTKLEPILTYFKKGDTHMGIVT
jgi:CBS domain containing-hemolysin-like protein